MYSLIWNDKDAENIGNNPTNLLRCGLKVVSG